MKMRKNRMGWWEPELQLEGYGSVGCSEWTILRDRLDLLLKQAEASNATTSNAYLVARSYYDNNTGWLNGPAVLFGSACEAYVKEINAIVKNLTSAISSSGSVPVIEGPDQQPGESAWDALSGTVKWVVGGAVAISAAVLAVKVLPFFDFMKPKRRRYGALDPEQRDLEGYSKKRRKRRQS